MVTKYSRADALRQQRWWRKKRRTRDVKQVVRSIAPNIRRHPCRARGRESSPLLETIYSHGLARNLLPQLLLRHPTKLVTRVTRIIEWEPNVAARNRISRDICCAASYLARWSPNSRMQREGRGRGGTRDEIYLILRLSRYPAWRSIRARECHTIFALLFSINDHTEDLKRNWMRIKNELWYLSTKYICKQYIVFLI